MNIPSAAILAGLAAISGLTAGTPDAAPLPVAQQPAKDARTLIRELADESFRVRENASRDLWTLGEGALDALNEAADSSDPEQAYRVRDLLRKIQLHITPDTDPSVIGLVERYLKASITEKATLLGRMRGKCAWRQMLKLYASEASADAREKLRDSVTGVAVIAARERIAKGDSKGAREFLEMAPADAEGLLALAEYHRSHGTLDAELDRAKSLKGVKSAFWQLALQRAAGNLEAARDAATAAGEVRIAAMMAALSGDPLPWLRNVQAESDHNPVSATYAAAAIRRWLGKKVRPDDLEPLTKTLTARGVADRGLAINALFLLGEEDGAKAALVKAEPLVAFGFYQSLERFPEALKSLGLDPDHPDYKSWVEKRVAKFSGEEIEDQHEVSTDAEDLVALANFLERKGLHEDAFAAFSGPLAALAEKDADDFIDFLGKLVGSSKLQDGAPMLAKRIGIVWAGNDEARWNELVIAVLGDDENSKDWWKWLEELAPTESRAERFDGLMAVFSLGTDPARLREKWLARAWKAVEEAPAGERGILAERISTASLIAGDVAGSLKSWDLLPEGSRGGISQDQHISHLTAAGRWADAVAVVLKRISDLTKIMEDPRADLHAFAAALLRKAGRADEAATHDQWADKLALGDPVLAVQIGTAYQLGGDHQRAAGWWARAAREVEPDFRAGMFSYAMELHADALLDEGRWKECAAVSEVIACMFATSEFDWRKFLLRFTHHRLHADMARALGNLKNDRAGSIAILDKLHRSFITDGILADYFFPSVRKMGLIEKHDEWFDSTWEAMEEVIRMYPDADNTRNTAAWFASRALRNLDEGEKHLAAALASNPDQSAYLDTMAEIQFARGNRGKALEWSEIAMNFDPEDSQIRRQHERFRTEPLPK